MTARRLNVLSLGDPPAWAEPFRPRAEEIRGAWVAHLRDARRLLADRAGAHDATSPQRATAEVIALLAQHLDDPDCRIALRRLVEQEVAIHGLEDELMHLMTERRAAGQDYSWPF